MDITQGPSAQDPLFSASPTTPSPLPAPSPLPSYWLNTSAPPTPAQGVYGPDEPFDDSVDVTIIGSGITGISAAYHLASKCPPRYDGQPRKIAVLEARDFCSGATGRNGGHCTPASVLAYDQLAANKEYLARFLNDTTTREEVYGNDRGTKTDEVVRKILTCEARTAAEILILVRMSAMRQRKAAMKANQQGAALAADPQTDVELVSGSNWHLCRTQEENQVFAQSLENSKRAGLSDFARQVRVVPSDEWQTRLHNPDGIVAVYETPGSTLHPQRLVALIHRLAVEAAAKSHVNIKVHTGTPVTAVTPRGQTWNTVRTHRGDISSKYVIHATNAYASHLIPQLAGPSGIVPTRAQCRAITPSTSPSPGEPLWQMGFDINNGYEYLQQRPISVSADNSPCIFGGGRWASKTKEFGEADDSTVNSDVSKSLRDILPRLFPTNFDAQTQPSLEWTGVMGWTKTNDPFVGPVVDQHKALVKGQYLAAGYSGHGMTRAFSCAEVVADMISAQEAGQEWEPPVWFPLCYLTAMPTLHRDNQPPTANVQAHALYAAGSNSGGQLGIGHSDDSHQWSPSHCRSASSSSSTSPVPFPPPSTRIICMKGGANHTLALISEMQDPSSTQLWVSGDATSQFPSLPHSDPTMFQTVPLPSHLETETWQVKLIAAAWETSYIVYTSLNAEQDDIVISVGKENDFGQSGRGEDWTWSNVESASEPLELPVPARDTRNSKLRITHIDASMRHVVLMATWTEKGIDAQRCALIGWGAGRHGQLSDLGSESSSSAAAVPGSRSKRKGVVWRPSVLFMWSASTSDSEPLSRFSVSVGRDHTLVLVPKGWREEERPEKIGLHDGTSSRVIYLGSDKYAQNPTVTSADDTLQAVRSTWNSTFIITPAGQVIAKGRNDHGQLASEHDGTSTLRTLPALQLQHSVDDIACGSEHALALVKGKVYGWGWNEHGNLALGGYGGDTEPEDQWSPVVVWPPTSDKSDARQHSKAVNVWAGCATTFVQVQLRQ